MQTIGASMQMLRAGESTRAHRHTGSFIYQVAKGRGHSIIDGKRFDWKERDIFCVPAWPGTSTSTVRRRRRPACSPSTTCRCDASARLYREEAFGDNGGRQPLAS